jgi:uncharacterized membrane protein
MLLLRLMCDPAGWQRSRRRIVSGLLGVAALHHEAILALMAQIDALTARVAELETKN